jgi:XTP/dITP diphosphohydrolase
MKKIIFATKNRGKLLELQHLFNDNKLDYKLVSLNSVNKDIEIIESGKTFLENALIKAQRVFNELNLPVIADDSGLVVEALGDEPGIFSSRYAGENATDEDNNNKLLLKLKNIKNRKAYFECALVFINENKDIFSAQERCFGEIIDTPRGNNGFGYDPIFFLNEFGKTMAEIDISIKNKISHRAKAFNKLIQYLKNRK